MKASEKLEVVWEYEYSSEDQELVTQAFEMILSGDLSGKDLPVSPLPSSRPASKISDNEPKHITNSPPSGAIHQG